MKDIELLGKELKEAKNNVLFLLENPRGSVDFHGITYWASRVEKLRDEIVKVVLK